MLFGKSLATALACLTATALATARTKPPKGAYVVGENTSNGKYKTIQGAVDAVPKDSSGSYVIFIEPGTYEEQVLVPSMQGTLTIYGYTKKSEDYSRNTVTITHNLGADDAANNDATGTLRAKADGLKVYNVNLINTRGPGDQALALAATADKQGYYGCQFIGYQDTVYPNQGHQLYSGCYIEGAVDFIFGQRGIAWFDACDIGIVGKGWVTANGRTDADNKSYYVLNGGTIKDVNGVGKGQMYLGRPWREYSRVVVQKTYMDEVVNSAGWSVWNEGDERTDNVFYAEYKNSGAGAKGTRAEFSQELRRAVKLSDVMKDVGTKWIDKKYVKSQ